MNRLAMALTRCVLISVLITVATSASAQRHHVVDPGVPRTIPPLPYSVTDPYFEMTGVRIDVTQPSQHRYTIKIFAQPAANSYPRGGDDLLVVPVWRNRAHRWCWVQTLMVPIGAPTATTFNLDTKLVRIDDALMIEDWPAVSWSIDLDSQAKGMFSGAWKPTIMPVHRDQIHADCTE